MVAVKVGFACPYWRVAATGVTVKVAGNTVICTVVVAAA